MSSVVWDLRTALRDLFSEALDVPVYDGPVSRTTLPKAYVLIGSDGGEDGTGADGSDAMATEQRWAALTGGRRRESGEVVCSVWSWSGSTKFAPIREQTKVVLGAIETVLLVNRKMPTVLTAGWIELTRVTIRERHIEEGAVVRAVCTITYESQL